QTSRASIRITRMPGIRLPDHSLLVCNVIFDVKYLNDEVLQVYIFCNCTLVLREEFSRGQNGFKHCDTPYRGRFSGDIGQWGLVDECKSGLLARHSGKR